MSQARLGTLENPARLCHASAMLDARFLIITAALLASPLSVAAQTMSASEFDRYTQGKTLFFGQSGQVYGAERYLPNRRVIWSFLDGACKDGHWYEQNGDICFVYEDTPDDPQCWQFQRGPRGLIALFQDDTPSEPLYEVQELDRDMICLGPNVGV